MKYLGLTILILFWFLISLCLVLTLIGIVVFVVENDEGESFWFSIVTNLIKGFNN